MAVKDPILSDPQIFARSSRSKSKDEYIRELEDLMRRKRDAMTTYADETGAEGGYIVHGGVPVKQGQFVPQTAGQTNFTNITPPQYGKIPKFERQELKPQREFFDEYAPTQEEFIQARKDYAGRTQQGSTESLQQRQEDTGLAYGIAQMADGGVLYSDGNIRYNDGTIRQMVQGNAQPIQQMRDGSVRYSDGSVRRPANPQEYMTQDMVAPEGIMSVAGDRERILYNDNQVRYGRPLTETGQMLPQYEEGMRGLTDFIFDNPDQRVTQAYGNYNPGWGYYNDTHMGTDFPVRNLEGANQYGIGAPASTDLGGQVFAVGDQGNRGWGKYVVIEYPGGHKLQFSHLNSIDVRPGQQLQGDEVFGTYGTSGNSSGPHLDLQYFSPDQQFDPSQPFTAQIFRNGNIPKDAREFVSAVLRNPQEFTTVIPGQAGEGEIVPLSELPQSLQQQLASKVQSTVEGANQRTVQRTGQPAQQVSQMDTPVTDAITGAVNTAAQAPQAAANLIDRVQPTGQFDAGVSETLRGDLPGALQAQTGTLERLGTATQAPGLGVGELGRGDIQGARQELGQTVAQTGQRLGLPELQISEQISGEKSAPEIYRDRSDLVKPSQNMTLNATRQFFGNLAETAGDVLGVPETRISEIIAGGDTRKTGINQAQASTNQSTRQQQPGNLMTDVQDIISSAKQDVGNFAGNVASNASDTVSGAVSGAKDFLRQFQPGAGISRLKGAGADGSDGAPVNLFSRQAPEDLAPGRVVGESGTGDNILGTQTVDNARSNARLDTTDPFFKSEIFQKLAPFTKFEGGKPGKDQALSMDVFKESFYEAPERVSQAFGKTFMEQPALKKATDKVKQAFRAAYSDPRYDQADVERIINSLPSTLNYTPNLPEPKRSAPKRQPTLEEYLAAGKTAAQYYAETGQQSSADSAGGAQNAANNYFDAKAQAYRQQQAAQNMSQDPRVVQRNAVSTAIKAASQGVPYYSNTGNRIVNYSPKNAQMTDAGTGLPVPGYATSNYNSSQNMSVAPKQQTSLFDRGKNFVSGIFNRLF